MKVFYHDADLDGICCAAIMYWTTTSSGYGSDVEYIGMDYGDPFPWDEIEDGEEVWMLDFSLEPFDEMIRLNDVCQPVWVDHHKGVLEEASEAARSGVQIDGRRDVEVAACQLVWELCHSGSSVPPTVRLLSLYDTWRDDRHDWEDEILPFQFGMRARVPRGKSDEDPWDDYLWDDLLMTSGMSREGRSELIYEIIKQGRAILAYRGQVNAQVARSQAQNIEFEGHDAVAINGTCADNSQLFDVCEDSVLLINYYWVGPQKQWTVELFCDGSVDVGEIAQRYGGGGHPGAAGFQRDELPFDLA